MTPTEKTEAGTPARHRNRDNPPAASPPLNPSSFLRIVDAHPERLSVYDRLFPVWMGTYHEPFFETGDVWFHVRESRAVHQAIVSHADPEVVHLWRTVRNDPDRFYACLTTPVGASRETRLDASWDGAARAVAALRHLRAENGLVWNDTMLRAAHHALRAVEIHQWSAFGVLEVAQAGDFVYLDPPVVDTTRHSPGTPRSISLRALSVLFRELDRRGVQVMLATAYVPRIGDVFRNHRVDRVEAWRPHRTAVSTAAGPASVLIRNYRT